MGVFRFGVVRGFLLVGWLEFWGGFFVAIGFVEFCWLVGWFWLFF